MMTSLVEAELTQQELVWIDRQIMRGRFASRADAILGLLNLGLESERMPASYINDPQHWKDRADEMRALAENLADAENKEIMLRLAADYDKLAARAAMRADGIVPRSVR